MYPTANPDIIEIVYDTKKRDKTKILKNDEIPYFKTDNKQSVKTDDA